MITFALFSLFLLILFAVAAQKSAHFGAIEEKNQHSFFQKTRKLFHSHKYQMNGPEGWFPVNDHSEECGIYIKDGHFFLNSHEASYVMRANISGDLEHLHWGMKIDRNDNIDDFVWRWDDVVSFDPSSKNSNMREYPGMYFFQNFIKLTNLIRHGNR